MFEKLLDMNVLYGAYKKSISGVDWKCSVQRYESNVLQNLVRLRRSLIDGTYKQKPFYEFDINERGKHRHIKALSIYDRVLQRALCDEILIPTLAPYLIYDNGASVKGKGIDFTRDRLLTHLRKYYRKHGNVGYILTLDYAKFFDSIPHDKVIAAIGKHIDDERVMGLIRHMVSTFNDSEYPRSLGIGSQISQVAGIYYLTEVDNYCKIVRRCKYYGRYMDDLYIIHYDKKFLQEMMAEIIRISNGLGLTVNRKKTQICRIDKGFTFLKLWHIVTPTGKIIRKPCKANVTRERRKLKKLRKKDIPFKDIEDSYKSWRGNMARYNAWHIIRNMDKLFEELYRNAERNGAKSNRGAGNTGRTFQCA